ncbi:MAG TPA: response regulator [Rhizomicrobium sp.]|jgi:two-component system chemotaxis response regulator CheY|nr:response regulator [Rhizomicrobium sp.]
MADGHAMRILVVDDQRAMRTLIRSTLFALHCSNIVECGDGEEALSELSVGHFDLVISDLNMPNLDGLGLLRAVRSNPDFGRLPFIMLTSRGESALVKQAIDLGVNNYVIKPFNLVTLKSKIESVMGPLA